MPVALRNPPPAPIHLRQRRLPNDDDRRPNNLIQSDDPTIVSMAKSVAPDETDPMKLGIALEQFVRHTIKLKDFSQAFATAAEVARNPEGDCTEHSVLLAALARARGIPARVAIGLVYQDGKQSFAYHMWNEFWTRRPLGPARCHAGPRRHRRRTSDAHRLQPRRRPSLQLFPARRPGHRPTKNRNPRSRVTRLSARCHAFD